MPAKQTRHLNPGEELTPNWSELLHGLTVSSSDPSPLYQKIVDRIQEAIDGNLIAEGSRLPTNRELAKLLSVDRSTALRAYSELRKRGYLESHVGRGSYACRPARESKWQSWQPGFDWQERFSRASHTVSDIFSTESERYEWNPEIISFAGGIPSFDNYPTSDFESILNRILKENRAKELFEYSPAEGHGALRKQVLEHLERSGNPSREEELLIVSGSQQGIDIVSGVMLDPGDYVALEDPTYLWATCSFKSRQARCLPVPLDGGGIRLDVLESQLKRYRPKFIYVIPNFQNPTGLTMPLKRREELLALANKYQTPILEDDFVGDLRYEGERLPSLRALPGGKELVIHQGTFSKALCPALRLGWLVAPEKVISRLILAKRASNLSTNSLSQIILAEFLQKGLMQDHLVSITQTYRSRRDEMLRSLDREFGASRESTASDISWSRPQGGMFIWLRLPDGYSSRELLRHAMSENVSFAPGHLCFASQQNTQYLRLCFIQNDVDSIKNGITRLSRAFKIYETEKREDASRRGKPVFTGGGHTFI